MTVREGLLRRRDGLFGRRQGRGQVGPPFSARQHLLPPCPQHDQRRAPIHVPSCRGDAAQRGCARHGRPKYRCIVRWRAPATLAEELARVRLCLRSGTLGGPLAGAAVRFDIGFAPANGSSAGMVAVCGRGRTGWRVRSARQRGVAGICHRLSTLPTVIRRRHGRGSGRDRPKEIGGNGPTYGTPGQRQPSAPPPEPVQPGKLPARRSGSCRIHGGTRG